LVHWRVLPTLLLLLLSSCRIFGDVGDYVCLPTAEQIEKARLKKLAEMEAKKQEAAAATGAEMEKSETEFEGDEEEMALLQELMGKPQPQGQQINSLHERELKYREQNKGKDYFGNVKDDGEEEEEETYVPKIKIKGVSEAISGGGDDTNEVEMDLDDDEQGTGPAPGPTMPPSLAAGPAAYPLGPSGFDEASVGPQMPDMPGPGYPEAVDSYPDAYPEPYSAGALPPLGGEQALFGSCLTLTCRRTLGRWRGRSVGIPQHRRAVRSQGGSERQEGHAGRCDGVHQEVVRAGNEGPRHGHRVPARRQCTQAQDHRQARARPQLRVGELHRVLPGVIALSPLIAPLSASI
jgi:hypothetical protein